MILLGLELVILPLRGEERVGSAFALLELGAQLLRLRRQNALAAQDKTSMTSCADSTPSTGNGELDRGRGDAELLFNLRLADREAVVLAGKRLRLLNLIQVLPRDNRGQAESGEIQQRHVPRRARQGMPPEKARRAQQNPKPEELI